MKISSKQEFNSLVKTLKSLLAREQCLVKTTRAQELLAKSLDYKTANSLLAKLPIDIHITNSIGANLSEILHQKHNAKNINGILILSILEQEHMSYSTMWKSDAKCYPKTKAEYENYWYLTRDGWLPWDKIDLSKMRTELNVFKVVETFSYSVGSIKSRSMKPIWDASIAAPVFELEANKLEEKFGEYPNNSTYDHP